MTLLYSQIDKKRLRDKDERKIQKRKKKLLTGNCEVNVAHYTKILFNSSLKHLL